MTAIITAGAGLALAIWVWLILCRGGFWRADERIVSGAQQLIHAPPVTVVMPARNEAETVGRAVTSLLRQDYAGRLDIVVVDDGSDDGTADRVAEVASGFSQVHVVPGKPLPAGWIGKMWALDQGVAYARQLAPEGRYLLLTDADIDHDAGNVRRLVYKAETEGRLLVSVMVRLHTQHFWERLLIPAFVFFFQKLYPFSWVNNPAKRTAAAAGGCMLLNRDALEAIGGIAAVRGELIDDCALARRIKAHGPIWLGLSSRIRSLRRYAGLGGLWQMVARTAFTQLGYSVLALAGTVVAMTLTYLVPPIAFVYGVVTGALPSAVLGGIAWALMIRAQRPTLALYRLAWWRGTLLPFAALLFTLMTLDSARRHWQGRGGTWKGRHYGTVGSGLR